MGLVVMNDHDRSRNAVQAHAAGRVLVREVLPDAVDGLEGVAHGVAGADAHELVGELTPGGAAAISANPSAADVDEQDDALDRAAMEFGTD